MARRRSWAAVCFAAAVIAVVALASGVRAEEEDGPTSVTMLTPDNFDSVVGASKPVLVAFTAPW